MFSGQELVLVFLCAVVYTHDGKFDVCSPVTVLVHELISNVGLEELTVLLQAMIPDVPGAVDASAPQ